MLLQSQDSFTQRLAQVQAKDLGNKRILLIRHGLSMVNFMFHEISNRKGPKCQEVRDLHTNTDMIDPDLHEAGLR